MPHGFVLVNASGRKAMRDMTVPGLSDQQIEESVAAVLENYISAAFGHVVGETLIAGEQSKIRGFFPTSSMRVGFTLTVVAWFTPERDAKREQIRDILEELVRTCHPGFSDANVFLNIVEDDESQPDRSGDLRENIEH